MLNSIRQSDKYPPDGKFKEFLKEASGIKNYADEFLDYTKQRQSKESDIAGFITILDELLKRLTREKIISMKK